MSARSKARKRALDVLYAADVRRVTAASVLDELKAERAAARDEMNPYVIELVDGVTYRRARIDELLATLSEDWTVDRMPAVDRNILRIGAYELLWGNDIPTGVAIDEAVSMASELSTDDSGKFVNGMLARLLDLKPSLPEGRPSADA